MIVFIGSNKIYNFRIFSIQFIFVMIFPSTGIYMSIILNSHTHISHNIKAHRFTPIQLIVSSDSLMQTQKKSNFTNFVNIQHTNPIE